jgi:hypothetical protein
MTATSPSSEQSESSKGCTWSRLTGVLRILRTLSGYFECESGLREGHHGLAQNPLTELSIEPLILIKNKATKATRSIVFATSSGVTYASVTARAS